jgi:hypothetical protein
MRPLYILLATAVVLGTACTDDTQNPDPGPMRSGTYAYEAFGSSGRRILTGWVTIQLHEDSTATASWEIDWAPGADTTLPVGPQVGEGTATGYQTAEGLVLDLNPDANDNNVVLRAVQVGNGYTIAGRWSYLQLTGPRAEGRFEGNIWR